MSGRGSRRAAAMLDPAARPRRLSSALVGLLGLLLLVLLLLLLLVRSARGDPARPTFAQLCCVLSFLCAPLP